MGVIRADKQLSTHEINCGESFKVKLSLTAAPDIVTNPVDIVLILDRSMSMAGSPLENMKRGAEKFIDIIDEATDGVKDGHIGNGSHIGIVSFSDMATELAPLMTSAETLKNAVNGITAGGRTNHSAAFERALQLFNPISANEKIMVMFTDGKTTVGGNAAPAAAAAKAKGVKIYCIGLSGNGGIDEDALKEWASDPDSEFVAITPDDSELEDLFENLAQNISKPGATNIVLTDKISSCFKITSINSPTKGSASLIGTDTVQWKIAKLGEVKDEYAELEFTVMHVGPCTGSVKVNESITYSDNEGNKVTFPSPEIYVDCGVIVPGETCPTPVEIEIGGCSDSVEYDADDIEINSLGRILSIDATVKHVCPGKRVALAVVLTETDEHGIEHKRGLKTITVPAHSERGCRDVKVRCIKFVLPEDLNVSGETGSICGGRNLKARFIAHYIDSDFDCCNMID